jgi:EmrB/QacA subfamily drug resistance transporter
VIGGFLVEHVSWQSIFFVNVPIGVIAVFVTLFAAHESRDETVERVVDLPGVLSVSAGLASLTLALVEANHWGWGSPAIVALLISSAVLLAAFFLVEHRTRVPMVDFSFFRSRSFAGANLAAFCVSFAMMATFFFITLYMQNVRHYSPLGAGLRFLPMTMVLIAMGPISGRMVNRVGPKALIAAGMAITAVALVWLSFLDVDTGYAFLLPPFMVQALGMGLVMSPMSTAAMNAVVPTKAGVASGILGMARMVGGTFGVAALGALVSAVGRSDINGALPHLSAAARDRLAENLGTTPTAGLTADVARAATDAFVHAIQVGLKVSAAVSLVGAAVAFALVSNREEHNAGAEAPVAATPAPEPARAERAAMVEA